MINIDTVIRFWNHKWNSTFNKSILYVLILRKLIRTNARLYGSSVISSATMSRTRPNSAERRFGNGISWLSLSAGPVMQSLFCTRAIHMLSCYANVVCPCVFHGSIASHKQREINDGSDIKRAALCRVTFLSSGTRAFWRLSLSVWSKCQSLHGVAYPSTLLCR